MSEAGKVLVYCSNCGKEIWRTSSRARSKNHFCNFKCHGAWMSKQPSSETPRAKYTHVTKSDIETLYHDQKLATTECAHRLNMSATQLKRYMQKFGIVVRSRKKQYIRIKCLICNKVRYLKPGIVNNKRNRKPKYCSTKCANEAKWTGGIKEQRKRQLCRIHTIPKLKLRQRISNAIRESLKEGKRGRHWETLIGYTLNDLMHHLKKTMPKGYSWQDYLDAKLHIDHIIPVSAFHFESYNDLAFKECWALNNLRFLPAKDNLRKHNKLLNDFQPVLNLELEGV